MKTTVFAITLFATFQLVGKTDSCIEAVPDIKSFSPADSTKKAFDYRGGNIALGGSYGIHPNYRNRFARAYQFTEGIKHFDIGTISLSRSSLSNYVAPINRVNLSGEYYNWYYSPAVGFSLPNQLFSSRAFDQLISNSGNIFNVNDFFAVSSIRFI